MIYMSFRGGVLGGLIGRLRDGGEHKKSAHRSYRHEITNEPNEEAEATGCLECRVGREGVIQTSPVLSHKAYFG